MKMFVAVRRSSPLSSVTGVFVLMVVIISVNLVNAQNVLCPNITWLLSVNTNYYGGINISATNLTDCQNKCASNMTCSGIDWNQGNSPGQQCWMIGPWAYYQNFGQAYGIQHYDIVRNINCPECMRTWTLVANTNVNGGVLRSDASDIRNCQVFCVSTASCTGIDWNPSSPVGSQCWLINGNSQQKNVGMSSGVLHYDLMRIGGCPTVGNLIISKLGGYLTVDQMRAMISLTLNPLDAVYFTFIQPCLALKNGVSSSFYQPLEAGLPANSACLSMAVPDWPGWFARDRGCGVFFEQPTGQRFLDRFFQDTSFVGTVIDSTYSTLQSTTYDNVYFMVNANGSAVQFDSTTSPPGGPTSQMMDATQFALIMKPLNSGPIVHVCPNIWTRVDSAGVASGGIYVSTSQLNSSMMPSGDSTCRQLCISYPYCVGVSYNSSGCYMMTNSGVNQHLVPSDTTTHWEITRSTFPGSCSTGCVYDWSPESTGFNYFSAYNLTEAWTAYECREACISAGSMCDGVNFALDRSGQPQCLLYKVYYNWNTHYPISANFMKKTAAYAACGSCSTSVGLHVNKTDMAAVLTPSFFNMTLPECLTACYNNPYCIGMELRPNGSVPKSPIAAASFQSGLCYQSLKSNGDLQLQDSSLGVTHFDVYQNPCGNGCVNRWQHFYNTYAAIFTPVPTVTSEFACRRSCVLNSTCTGINWNYYSSQCYLTTGYALAQIGTAPGWNYFLLLRGQLCD